MGGQSGRPSCSRCTAAAGRGRHHLDCNPIPDAARPWRDGAVRRFADPLTGIALAGQGKPTASRRWPPSCASSAPGDRSADVHRGHTTAALATRGHRPPTTTTACDVSVAAAFNPLCCRNAGKRLVGLAGPARSASTTRAASARPSRTLRDLFGVASADPRQVPVITTTARPRPARDAAARVRRRAGYHLLDSGALSAPPGGVAVGLRCRRRRRRAGASGRCARPALATVHKAAAPGCAGREVSEELRPSRPACWLRGSRHWRRFASIAGSAAGFSPPAGLVADGRDMGTVFSAPPGSRSTSPRAPASAPAAP